MKGNHALRTKPGCFYKLGFGSNYFPEAPKYLTNTVFRVSRLGIIVMVWGRYFIYGYLDPRGS